MKAIQDPRHALTAGLAAIRLQYQVPDGFPTEVLAAAAEAARRAPNAHRDRTSEAFVTLDPATSTDLDQAFAIEAAGDDLILYYAIADVSWFVDDGGVIDVEAWRRGTTLYLPDGKAGLYPPALSEAAASLLPDGPRPAVVFAVRIDPAGKASLDSAERALIRSRAKLAYDAVNEADLPAGFAELSRRIVSAEAARGASRVDPPEQEVAAAGEGCYTLSFRPRFMSESRNAALSLAANLAIADALLAAHAGLFRVMAEPDDLAVGRLRQTAKALHLDWPATTSLKEYERALDPADHAEAAMMLAVRRAGEGASYQPYNPGEIPWHSAMAATYVHATAPLRRLADRYVVMAALAVANGQPVSDDLRAAFARLPKIMARADAQSAAIERAVIDLAEAVTLQGREGEAFDAVVTDEDERGARIQLEAEPIVARVVAHAVEPGTRLRVRLAAADPAARTLTFERLT
ncbi:RNB domain-containing ribonuclease [Sphingomonas sp. KRR8]|uniref:RNB domain-containing ribonuclease n=1 Tax=Sphingomonas sp. KRR8 TaxID=2942996 RepID=UPI002021EF4C|nr:RNB domain-containing ribonuclease [Sphingomonas sp. KRR8]URD61838.1 RNB domain-containing ribonuclease [Sphingomonas sp. KRR8]